MTEHLPLTTARVDNMPRFLAQAERLGLPPLMDEPFPTHGNGVGRSLGWVSMLWLTPIRSEAAHRLHHVAPWTTPRRHTVRHGTGQPVHPVDVSDDRLATVLAALRHATR